LPAQLRLFKTNTHTKRVPAVRKNDIGIAFETCDTKHQND